MRGKAHVYKRNHINTDEIIPARYLNIDKEAELAKHAMEDIDKTFIRKVKKGDFIVAGENFGCGSSREHAVWALRGAGIKAVIADSFARIFFRNCINNGEQLEIDVEKGTIKTNKKEFKFTPFPKFAVEIIKEGGLLNYIKK